MHGTSKSEGFKNLSNESIRNERVPPPKKQKHRVSRPGFNSYLKVILDDDTMDFLYSETQQLKADFENSQLSQARKASETTQNIANDQDTNESDHNDKRTLKIVSRSRNSLHLTFFFGGETLCQLPVNELEEWHALVQERLGRSGFGPFGSASGKDQDKLSFKIKEFRTFPPKRNYLIVAVLEATAGWNQLHDDIRETAKNSSSGALKAVLNYSKDRWTPHITLANIQGGNPQERERLLGLLANIKKYSNPIMARAITMGGPVPSQVELCWDFCYEASEQEHDIFMD